MTSSILRLNHFIAAANQAASMPKCLKAGANDRAHSPFLGSRLTAYAA